MRQKSHVEYFYDNDPQKEWDRLDHHRTEFAITLKALHDFLPPIPGSILDIGGGPGRYAIELTKNGYSVTLIDLAQNNLLLARQKSSEVGIEINRIELGNALALSKYRDNSFDAVLILGPLYHLINSEDRSKAVFEAKRVLKNGGIMFASFISRYGVFLDASSKYPKTVFEKKELWEQIWRDGINPPPHDSFTDAYFIKPDEIKPFMEREGLSTLALLGLEGIVFGHEEEVNVLDGAAWEYWTGLNYQFAKDPALHAMSGHLLYIGKK